MLTWHRPGSLRLYRTIQPEVSTLLTCLLSSAISTGSWSVDSEWLPWSTCWHMPLRQGWATLQQGGKGLSCMSSLLSCGRSPFLFDCPAYSHIRVEHSSLLQNPKAHCGSFPQDWSAWFARILRQDTFTHRQSVLTSSPCCLALGQGRRGVTWALVRKQAGPLLAWLGDLL